MDTEQTDEGDGMDGRLLRPKDELVLVLTSEERGVDSCLDLLCDPAADSVLRVSYGGTRSHVAEDWAAAFGAPPRQSLEVVASHGDVRLAGDGGGRTETVVPGDLTGLGVKLSRVLEQCRVGEVESTLCFDSLTIVLQYVDQRVVFRFLHTLAGLIRRAGTRAHFHLDRSAVDERAVATLMTLFDTVVSFDADGEVSVQSS